MAAERFSLTRLKARIPARELFEIKEIGAVNCAVFTITRFSEFVRRAEAACDDNYSILSLAAIGQKLIMKNSAQGCALPKVEHQEMKTLTPEQLGAFFREAKESGVYGLYYLNLATGLRRRELLGLKWSDVDFQRETLKIQRAISRQNGEVTVAPLKTKNASRTLPLSADAIGVLYAQKKKVVESECAAPIRK